MTTEMMGWLNQNRYRSYPMVRDEWREKVSPDSGLDKVLLDVLVFDSNASRKDLKDLVVSKIVVTSDSTEVFFKYGDAQFSIPVPEGEPSGEGSYVRIRGVIPGTSRDATISLVFSSRANIDGFLPIGEWELGCRVLSTRVVGLSDGYGVDGISTNGSAGVDGHDAPASASGEVVLEDGYRTSPIISGGKVHVRVGRRYGQDPCGHDYGEAGSRDCRKPLFFFCGQNAVNSGNIVIKGGVGVNVVQGRNYTVRDGICAGKSIPAIEIIAGRELLDMYKPL